MAYEPRLLAPYEGNTGLVEYYKPWLVGDVAFPVLEDAYVWRSKVRKRDGYDELAFVASEATVNNITNANPGVVTVAAIGNLQNGDIITIRGVVGMTQVNELTFRVAGIAGNNFNLTDLNGVNFSTNVADGFGVYAGGGTIHLPVNGLAQFLIINTLDEQLIAFTRYKASIFNAGPETFADISFFQTTGAAISWAGTLNGYYWSTNYAQSLWVTNNVDPIRFYNGNAVQGWNNQRFITNAAGHTVTRARLIFPYYSRLVLLDTTENAINFHQRARFSQIGSPYTPASGGDPAVVVPAGTAFGTDAAGWLDDTPGRGGYIDADTSERIISAAMVGTTLIVFFQYSTWRLRYTGNQILPFIWERINSNYGSECEFGSIVDNVTSYTISRRGIIGANPNEVQRIDTKIPDRAFGIETGATVEGMNLVSATRDFYKNLLIWSIPSAGDNATTPNKMIVYNVAENAWAIFNLSIRVFGQYKEFDDRTWAMFNVAGRDEWSNQTENYWINPAMQDNSPVVVGGHLNGMVYRLFEDVSDGTDAGTRVNFDIQTKRFNPYFDKAQDCRLEYVDLYMMSTTQSVVNIIGVSRANPGVVETGAAHGLVSGSQVYLQNVGGMINVNNVKYTVTVIDATHFSIGVNTTGFPVYTAGGQMVNSAEITLELYCDDNDTVPVITQTVDISTPDEDSTYRRVFLGQQARFHQIRLLLTDSQLADNIKGRAGFEFSGMVIWTRPISRIKGKLL